MQAIAVGGPHDITQKISKYGRDILTYSLSGDYSLTTTTRLLTLGARSHILIKILKDYCKDFGVLFTNFFKKIFERF